MAHLPLNFESPRIPSEEGQALVEYAVILSLVFVVVLVVLRVLGADITDVYVLVEDAVDGP
jgi:Flp pilus assembly pilin Flp